MQLILNCQGGFSRCCWFDWRAGQGAGDTITGGAGNDVITGDSSNNESVDLSGIFNAANLAAYNLANGIEFTTPLQTLHHDAADGVINFNGTDVTGPTLTLSGGSGWLSTDETAVALPRAPKRWSRCWQGIRKTENRSLPAIRNRPGKARACTGRPERKKPRQAGLLLSGAAGQSVPPQAFASRILAAASLS